MTKFIEAEDSLLAQEAPHNLLLAQKNLGNPRVPSATVMDLSIAEAFPEIIGQSPAMLRVLYNVRKVAQSALAVMIEGESGTGKELIAAAVHRLSPRASRRFIAINCSAIPDTLLESELFGHEKGAFTGATSRRPGFFELAHGGSIFLDEIGDMPLGLQAKLLRVLQEKQYTPIGSRETLKTDVRIIAATNMNLKEAVKNQIFRQDLYYRLNVLPINLPPLRERERDIALLVEHFAQLATRRALKTRPLVFAPETLEELISYPWPGNVRELQSLVERLIVMHEDGPIRWEHLPEEFRSYHYHLDSKDEAPTKTEVAPHGYAAYRSPYELPEPEQLTLPQEGLDLIRYVEDLENHLILQALKRTNSNKNRAAQLLGLNRTTLVERIKKRRLGLSPPELENSSRPKDPPDLA